MNETVSKVVERVEALTAAMMPTTVPDAVVKAIKAAPKPPKAGSALLKASQVEVATRGLLVVNMGKFPHNVGRVPDEPQAAKTVDLGVKSLVDWKGYARRATVLDARKLYDFNTYDLFDHWVPEGVTVEVWVSADQHVTFRVWGAQDGDGEGGWKVVVK